MGKRKSTLQINADFKTGKLILKLKAIAKHAEALANELEEIENSVCPNCGNATMIFESIRSNGKPILTNKNCEECGYKVIGEVTNYEDAGAL